MDYAAKLRTLRAARGLTQERLGEMTGIPNSRISDMERGKTLPTGEWLAALRTALDWPEDEAFFEQLVPANVSGK